MLSCLPLSESAVPDSCCRFRRRNPSAYPTSMRAREHTLALDCLRWIGLPGHGRLWCRLPWTCTGIGIEFRGSSRTAGSVLLKETSVFYLVCKNLKWVSAGSVLEMKTLINILLLASFANTVSCIIHICTCKIMGVVDT